MIDSRIFRLSPVALLYCFAATLFAVQMVLMASAKATNVSASLTISEHQFAGGLANQQAWLQTRRAATTGDHPLGAQTLSIELDERKKNKSSRRARVYQYNYNTQQSRLILVDLINRDVVSEQKINSIHLPLNDQEIATARTMVENSPEIMAMLSAEHQTRGLPPLSNLDNLDVKASIYEPTDQSQLCADQRCALLSLFDHSRTVFAVEPVINLQRLTVTTLQQSL